MTRAKELCTIVKLIGFFMRKIIGIILALLSAYLFVVSVFVVVPNDSARAIGENIGANLVWITTSIISYFLLRK